MAAGDFRVGLDGKFLYGSAGSTASTESNNVVECTLNLSARTADTTRRGKTWATSKPVLLEATVDFTIKDVEGDALISTVRGAYIGKSRIALYPTDADGGEGLDADFYITAFTRNEPLEDVITYSVTAVPTDEERDPTWS